jgi:hypothetical protein
MLCCVVNSRLQHRNSPRQSTSTFHYSCVSNRLAPLFSFPSTRPLCFQHLAASFPKTPGWGVPPPVLRNLRPPRPRSSPPKSSTASPTDRWSCESTRLVGAQPACDRQQRCAPACPDVGAQGRRVCAAKPCRSREHRSRIGSSLGE